MAPEDDRTTTPRGTPPTRLLSIPAARDLLSLALAALIIIHETLFAEGAADPALLAVASALIGLPLVIRAEGSRK